MKKIIISERAEKKLFTESILMDKERGKSARQFRISLQNAITNGEYEFDPNSNTLYIDGYSYEIGKKYAERNDGEPIPLHYTYNTVQKLVQQLNINTDAQPNLNSNELANQTDVKYFKITVFGRNGYSFVAKADKNIDEEGIKTICARYAGVYGFADPLDELYCDVEDITGDYNLIQKYAKRTLNFTNEQLRESKIYVVTKKQLQEMTKK